MTPYEELSEAQGAAADLLACIGRDEEVMELLARAQPELAREIRSVLRAWNLAGQLALKSIAVEAVLKAGGGVG